MPTGLNGEGNLSPCHTWVLKRNRCSCIHRRTCQCSGCATNAYNCTWHNCWIKCYGTGYIEIAIDKRTNGCVVQLIGFLNHFGIINGHLHWAPGRNRWGNDIPCNGCRGLWSQKWNDDIRINNRCIILINQMHHKILSRKIRNVVNFCCNLKI